MQGLGLRVSGVGCKFRRQGLAFRICGVGCRAQGFGFSGLDLRFYEVTIVAASIDRHSYLYLIIH